MTERHFTCLSRNVNKARVLNHCHHPTTTTTTTPTIRPFHHTPLTPNHLLRTPNLSQCWYHTVVFFFIIISPPTGGGLNQQKRPFVLFQAQQKIKGWFRKDHMICQVGADSELRFIMAPITELKVSSALCHQQSWQSATLTDVPPRVPPKNASYFRGAQ